MVGLLSRFLHKAMMEIVNAPKSLFSHFYCPRPLSDTNLSARIRAAIFPGTNIFVVGRTGEGKTCFFRHYMDTNQAIDIGFSVPTIKALYYMPIYFDQPEWDPNVADSQLIETIVLGLQGYLSQIRAFPPDFDSALSPRAKYQTLITHLNSLDLAHRSKQLVVVIDDIDHAPVAFQMRFYTAIYPLLRSAACVCLLAVRPPALATALKRTSGKLAATFSEFDTVKLEPLPIRQLVEHRVAKVFSDDTLNQHIEEPDLSVAEVKSRYAYLPSERIDNFVQQYCNGNIREMTRLLVEIVSHLEKLREDGEEFNIGRTTLLELLERTGVVNVFNTQSASGYSLTYGCLELLRYKSRVDKEYVSAIAGLGFKESEVREAVGELYEADVIEEAYVRDSYSRIVGDPQEVDIEYVLTAKGGWLLTMSTWPQYRKLFAPPRRTLARGGVIFERRILGEFLEFVKEFLLVRETRETNFSLNWSDFWELFVTHVGDMPSQHGEPGKMGFGPEQLYRYVERAGVARRDLSNYPTQVTVSRRAFEDSCKRFGVDIVASNPFWDQGYFERHVGSVFWPKRNQGSTAV